MEGKATLRNQRSAKKIRKWKEKFERERELRQEIRAAAPDISAVLRISDLPGLMCSMAI